MFDLTHFRCLKRWSQEKNLEFLEYWRAPKFPSKISWPLRNLYSKCDHNIYADQLLSCAVQWSLCQAKLALLLEYPSKKAKGHLQYKNLPLSDFCSLVYIPTSNINPKYFESYLGSHSLILNKFGKSVDRFWHADKHQTNWPKKALKISKFQKQIFLFLFEPKNEWNLFLNSALASKTSQINHQFN